MDRPHPLRICLRPIYYPIIYRTAAVHFHTLVYHIRPQTRRGPVAPSVPIIGPTTPLRGRTSRLNNFTPPSAQCAYDSAPGREVRPRSAMAAQALDRQDSGMASRLAMVFIRFARCGERGCGRCQFRPRMCGNLFVASDGALARHCSSKLTTDSRECHGHPSPYVYSCVYYNRDICMRRAALPGYLLMKLLLLLDLVYNCSVWWFSITPHGVDFISSMFCTAFDGILILTF